jgi:hypothetical protein
MPFLGFAVLFISRSNDFLVDGHQVLSFHSNGTVSSDYIAPESASQADELELDRQSSDHFDVFDNVDLSDFRNFPIVRGLTDRNRPYEETLIKRRPIATPATQISSIYVRSPVSPSGKGKNSLSLPYGHLKTTRPILTRAAYADSYDSHGRYYDYQTEPFYAPTDEPYNDGLNGTLQWIYPTYRLLTVFPNRSHSHGQIQIAIQMEPIASCCGFCRFDTVIVRGTVNSSGFGICIAPPHRHGLAALWWSKDQKRWSGPITFWYLPPTGRESLLMFAPTGLLLLGSCALLIWFVSYCTDRNEEKEQYSNAGPVWPVAEHPAQCTDDSPF